MSHLLLSLISRRNQTKSVIFKLWMLYHQKISFLIIQISKQLSLCRVVALKCLTVRRYSFVVYTLDAVFPKDLNNVYMMRLASFDQSFHLSLIYD